MDNSTMKKTLEHLAGHVRQTMPERPEDYYVDGLLHCGICRTPKEIDINWCGTNARVPMLCACEKGKDVEAARIAEATASQAEILTLRAESMIDEKFQSSTFDSVEITPDIQKPLALSRKYADSFGTFLAMNKGLLFYGNTGTGKTLLASCIGNQIMAEHHPVFAVSLVQLLQQVKNYSLKVDISSIIRKMSRADLAIIDDLGAQNDTDYSCELVYSIVDSRYRSGKPMIVTTNLPIEALIKTQDIRLKRIYERVLHNCFPVEFAGESWRIREARDTFEEMKCLLGV